MNANAKETVSNAKSGTTYRCTFYGRLFLITDKESKTRFYDQRNYEKRVQREQGRLVKKRTSKFLVGGVK